MVLKWAYFAMGLVAVVTIASPDPAFARGHSGGGGSSHATSHRSSSHRAVRHARGHRAQGLYSGRGESSDGSCPCNGGKICVGPRGGRYCITSGGNKRYGV